MSNLATDKVLRVNCPGWGITSTLPLGEAKPLAMYDVIVINPTSIIHLFEPKSDQAKQIDKLIAEGSSLLKLDSDSTLESISAELELREHELRQFLAKGGLLVFFLAPPFTVSGATVRMDNYMWLYECSPDKLDGNARTMSPSKGKEFNVLARGKQHAFAPYLQQIGIEWTTCIRKENLTEGFLSLANGGSGKCVSGFKSTGPKKGQVVFLPAPYESRYDDVLKDCIMKWHELHVSPDADKPEAEVADEEDNEPDIEGRALLDNLFADDEASKKTAPYATPAMSATSDFDALDALFSPGKSDSPGKESSESVKLYEDDDPLAIFDEPKPKKADKSADLFDEPASKMFDEPPEKKKSTLDWPELEDDVPPFAKEREKEREKERTREEEREQEREKNAVPKMEPSEGMDFAAALASELNDEVKLFSGADADDDDDDEDLLVARKDEREPVKEREHEDSRDEEKSRERQEERDEEEREKTRELEKPYSSSNRDKEREEEKVREEERDRDRDKERSREEEKDREKSRDEERDRDKDKDRSREDERDREKSRDEDRDHDRDKAREEERDREKSRDEDRDREKSRDGDRDREHSKDDDRDREKSRDEERDRERAREEEKEREREKAREEEKERDLERAREEEKDREREKIREEERERDREKAREEDKERERERAREEEREKIREEERERERAKQREEERELEEQKAREEERERERQRISDEDRAREREIEEHEREKSRAEDREREKAREMQRELDRIREEEEDRVKAIKEERDREYDRDKEAGRTSTNPEAKDLMSRMEQEISSPGVPDWCQKVSFAELKQLHFELGDLNEQVRRARQKIGDIEDRIRTLGELKDALLSLSGIRLTQACCKVFEALGWSVKISETSSGEVWLSEGDKTQAIVRIVFSMAQPNRSELAELAESVITYWGKYDVEPKGILVASTFADKAPKERTEEDFPGSMGEFAKRKNLCLINAQQLLTFYRDVSIKNADIRKIRENLLTTSGILPGFKLDMSEMQAEAAAK